GTSSGTVMLTNLNDSSGGLNPSNLTVVGKTLYFGADDGPDGDQLWQSDGTSKGTVMVTTGNDVVHGFGIYPSDLTNVNGTLYFQGYDLTDGYQLFQANGTNGGPSTGVTMVADINGGSSSYPSDFTAAGGLVYFQAYDAKHGYQLWETNGTSSGTMRL